MIGWATGGFGVVTLGVALMIMLLDLRHSPRARPSVFLVVFVFALMIMGSMALAASVVLIALAPE